MMVANLNCLFTRWQIGQFWISRCWIVLAWDSQNRQILPRLSSFHLFIDNLILLRQEEQGLMVKAMTAYAWSPLKYNMLNFARFDVTVCMTVFNFKQSWNTNYESKQEWSKIVDCRVSFKILICRRPLWICHLVNLPPNGTADFSVSKYVNNKPRDSI